MRLPQPPYEGLLSSLSSYGCLHSTPGHALSKALSETPLNAETSSISFELGAFGIIQARHCCAQCHVYLSCCFQCPHASPFLLFCGRLLPKVFALALFASVCVPSLTPLSPPTQGQYADPRSCPAPVLCAPPPPLLVPGAGSALLSALAAAAAGAGVCCPDASLAR